MNRSPRHALTAASRWLAALLLLGALSSDAHAQPKTPEAKEAKALFEQGMGLSSENKWPEALEAFEKSNKLVPLPVVQYNIAFTMRAMGRFVEAKQKLQAILDVAPTLKPPIKPNLQKDIDQLYSEVKEKIALVTITLDPADVDLQIDGTPTKLPMNGVVEMDTGKHVFVVKKDGYETNSVTKTIQPGASSLKVSAKLIPPPPPPPPPAPPPPRPFYSKPWFLTVAGVVLIGGAAAVVYVTTRPGDARQPAQPPSATTDRIIPATLRF